MENICNIDDLTVNNSWKTRFKIIEEWYEYSGIIFKMSEKLKNIPYRQRIKISNSIFFKNGGFGTFLAAYLFGPLYYLVKGMWLKAIVYNLILTVIFEAISIFIPSFKSYGSEGIFFAFFAPFDYYRLKVLHKQW